MSRDSDGPTPSHTELPYIELRGASFGYFEAQPVLERCDLRLGDGLTLLLGPNGCGKSTLLKLMAGIERPDVGEVLVCGHDLWHDEVASRRALSYLPEQPDLTPYATVGEILKLVAGLQGGPGLSVSEAIRTLGLTGLERRTVRQLSKGQRRRVILAAARLGRPRVLLLDEPLDALDRPTRGATLDWIFGHCAAGGAAVVVTHELEPFAAAVRRVVAVQEGRWRLAADDMSHLEPAATQHLEIRMQRLEAWAGGVPTRHL